MSSKISIGRPLESTGRPIELLYWTSPRAEDLTILKNKPIKKPMYISNNNTYFL